MYGPSAALRVEGVLGTENERYLDGGRLGNFVSLVIICICTIHIQSFRRIDQISIFQSFNKDNDI